MAPLHHCATDPRTVLTLDAGGTNFIFSAVRSNQEIVPQVAIKATGETLEIILKNIISGFEEVKSNLQEEPVAISFTFPGPADYLNGIIGDLQNLPLFRGGVALGPMLQEHFQVPVFINNDGDLFTYGEAIAGLLPEINKKLEEAGNPKRYQNLLGVTFGTGFGGGIVSHGILFIGDNSAAGEINRVRNRVFKNFDAEESVSIRGIQREYANYSGINLRSCPDPKVIFEIGMGSRKGNREAAQAAYHAFGLAAGDALANAATLVDGLVVIGGGLAGAHPLFLPTLVEEMNQPFNTMTGELLDRMEVKAYNLEDPVQQQRFFERDQFKIPVPFTGKMISYSPGKKIGVGISSMGTSRAVSLGAYAFALHSLDL
ncbi:MAG: ROK family protein [Bacteroidia bacterium]|nr:ROK family protein [Bacteroidia bacterium]